MSNSIGFRRFDNSRKILAIISLTLLGGCAGTRMPIRSWQMCFTSPDNDIILATVKAEDRTVESVRPLIRILMRTTSKCRAADHDSLSGRVATLESEDAVDVIRVYASDSQKLAEYVCSSKPGRGVSGLGLSLNAGGSRIAFVCDKDAICVSDVDTLHQRDMVQVIHRPQLDASSGNPTRIACVWDQEQNLIVGFDGSTYMVANGSEETRLLRNDDGLLLCSVVAGNPVGTTSDWGAWTFRKMATDEAIGKARSGHNYSLLEGMSPCGEYIMYTVPGAFSSSAQRYIHHLESGRRAALEIGPRWQLGSWGEARIGDEPENPGPARDSG